MCGSLHRPVFACSRILYSVHAASGRTVRGEDKMGRGPGQVEAEACCFVLDELEGKEGVWTRRELQQRIQDTTKPGAGCSLWRAKV